MNLWLCGLPCSGKTTWGKKIAYHLQWPFLDTDRLIEKLHKEKTGEELSCRSLFQQKGEPFFRSLEREIISSLLVTTNHVIALGGGSLQHHAPSFEKAKFLLYLETPSRVIWNRLSKKPLPPYIETTDPIGSFRKLVSERVPLYTSMAHLTLDPTLFSKEKLLQTIQNFLQGTTHGQ